MKRLGGGLQSFRGVFARQLGVEEAESELRLGRVSREVSAPSLTRERPRGLLFGAMAEARNLDSAWRTTLPL